MWIGMRRALATSVDFTIVLFLVALLVIPIAGSDEELEIFWKFGLVISLFTYQTIMDFCFKGRTIGKKVFFIKMKQERTFNNIRFGLVHGILKFASCALWPVLIVYYLIKRESPYDRLLGITFISTIGMK